MAGKVALLSRLRGLPRRRLVFGASALGLCLLIGVAGFVDHLVGDSAQQLAALEAHYCIHGPKPPGVDCSRVDPDGMWRAWHHREIAYATGMALALLTAMAALLGAKLRPAEARRRASAPRQS